MAEEEFSDLQAFIAAYAPQVELLARQREMRYMEYAQAALDECMSADPVTTVNRMTQIRALVDTAIVKAKETVVAVGLDPSVAAAAEGSSVPSIDSTIPESSTGEAPP